MLRLLLVFTLTIISIQLTAQKDKDIPGFGKIDKSDLEMKECELDKDAEAMFLIDYGTVEFQNGTRDVFALKKEIRRRVKIFNEKGFRYADVKIPYYSDDRYEKLIDLDAFIYNLDATGKVIETKVDKKSIFRQKSDSRFSTVTFTFPEVKVGSILEYRYTIVRDEWINIDPWVFQDKIPTRLSAFRIVLPEIFRYTTQQLLQQEVERKQDDLKQSVLIDRGILNFNSTAFSFKMKNVPAINDEPYMGSYRDYLQRIEFQLNQIVLPDGTTHNYRKTWAELIKNLMSSDAFGMQLTKKIPIGEPLSSQLKTAGSQYEKMNLIYKYVQKNIEWDGVEDFLCSNVKDIWNKKKGSTGDINLILLNLLKEANINSYPLLASTRENGRVITTYPLLRQFNTLIAMAVIDGKKYFLNAADKYNAAGLIPYDVMGTEALLVDKDLPSFIEIWNEKMMHRHFVSMQGNIDESGVLKGEATLTSFDYAKNPRVKRYKDGKDKFSDQYLTPGINNIKVEEIEVKNENNDSLPFEQKFKFSIPVTSSGDYRYFTLNMFAGLEKNPFISDNRQTVVEFGHNQYYMLVGSVAIPEGYVFEQPPQNFAMIMPDTSIVFRRIIETSNEKVSYRITLEFKRPFYVAEEYPAFKEFYKKLYVRLNEQIVFRKKTSPLPKP